MVVKQLACSLTFNLNSVKNHIIACGCTESLSKKNAPSLKADLQ